MNPVGFRFRPTDKELLDNYLRPKNLGCNTTDVDRVINTVDICSFDPWNLLLQSKIKSSDLVWYFFGRKKNKYNKGERQSRTTASGFWKKTGKTMNIMRNREKIGEKWILVFSSPNQTGSKSDWVMHEYHATDHMMPIMPYTICKLKYKGEIEHMDNNSRNEGSFSFDEIDRAFSNALSDEWIGLLDDYEQSEFVPMQEDRNNHKPQKPSTGVCDGYTSDDDNDFDSISAKSTISSIETLSTCDSFGSSNHRCIDVQESPNLSQKVSRNLGQAMIKKKKTGFFYKIIQRFKKIHFKNMG